MDNKHTPGKLFLDEGNFSINENSGELYIRIRPNDESDPETFDLCSLLADETGNAKANAARIVTCWNEYDQLKAENEKVNRLLHDLTPGGSEFYNDPEYCAKWIRENRTESHYNMGGIIKELKAQLEAAKEREKSFYMDICRAYNAGKENMRESVGTETAFISSHEYFLKEFPGFTTNVP